MCESVYVWTHLVDSGQSQEVSALCKEVANVADHLQPLRRTETQHRLIAHITRQLPGAAREREREIRKNGRNRGIRSLLLSFYFSFIIPDDVTLKAGLRSAASLKNPRGVIIHLSPCADVS